MTVSDFQRGGGKTPPPPGTQRVNDLWHSIAEHIQIHKKDIEFYSLYSNSFGNSKFSLKSPYGF